LAAGRLLKSTYKQGGEGASVEIISMTRFLASRPVAAAILATAVLAASAAVAAPGDDTIPTAAGPVALHAIHHAALTLTLNGLTILVDPAPLQSGGAPADPTVEFKALPAPGLILITHDHDDHFNVPILEAVAGKATIVAPKEVIDKMPADLQTKTKAMANGDTATIDGVAIEAFPMYNTTPDRQQFHPKGGGNGYILTMGDKRIYIAGDTEETPEMKALTNIDVAFLPMNVPYTMDIQHAAAAVKDFKPKVVYPYHYHGSDVEAFKTLVGDAADVRLLQWY
jgi:L-ascorbate metabolism protein UlaG (beta-lactamase superfamily)